MDDLSIDTLRQKFNELNSIIKALSHPSRLQIMVAIAEGEKNTTQLHEELEIKKTTLINHINELIKVELVYKMGHGLYAISSTGEHVLVHLSNMLRELNQEDEEMDINTLRLSVARSFLNRK
ncbi:MAG: winged helix-turn-helix transcriptional regulator [Candidatus Heimdallarchaeota archaeon]|nr:winged helix-turn-helix transcriptional regulator [Candidatus Heimdallarchaeota archaeon]